jgi:ABC-type nitrate/sulfonate/bicarbonate transport system substrate-binding protein
MRRCYVITGVVLLGIVVTFVLGHPALGPNPILGASIEPLALTWNVGTKGIQYADIYVAIEKGFFKELQIDVALTNSSTPPGTLLISGAVQISSGQPTFTYVPNAQGADLVAIYSPAATYEVWVAKPPIAEPRQLEGRTIGMFSLQDLDVVYTNQLMQQFGIKPSSYTLLAVGPTNNKVAAIVAGKVDAAPLYPPGNFIARQQGLVEIFNTAQLKFGQVPTFYEARRSWVQQHKPAIVNVIRALNKAHDWLFNPTNKTEGVEILAKHTSVSRDLVQQTYDLYFARPGAIYSRSGEWDTNVVRKIRGELVALGLLTAPAPAYESTVAPEYREQALKER